MNAHDTALAFAIALATAGKEALEPVHIYAHDVEVLPDGEKQYHVEEVQLPAVFVRTQFDALAGSETVGRGKVIVEVESQSDDSTSAQHSARETAVRQVLADMAALNAAFANVGTVSLLGRPCVVDNDPDVEARAFKTPTTYRVGVRVL